MKIVMEEQQYQELETLVEIFEGMFFDDEEVQCFRFIKKIVDDGLDTESIEIEKKGVMKKQLIESFEWLKSLNVNINYKDEFLTSFSC